MQRGAFHSKSSNIKMSVNAVKTTRLHRASLGAIESKRANVLAWPTGRGQLARKNMKIIFQRVALAVTVWWGPIAIRWSGRCRAWVLDAHVLSLVPGALRLLLATNKCKKAKLNTLTKTETETSPSICASLGIYLQFSFSFCCRRCPQNALHARSTTWRCSRLSHSQLVCWTMCRPFALPYL